MIKKIQFLLALLTLSVSFVQAQSYIQPEYTAVGYRTEDRYIYENFCRNFLGPIYNTQGQNIRDLQGVLRYQVYPSLGQTGYYGPLTRRAVQVFQRQYGIYPSGYVGPQTYRQMKSLWCSTNISQVNPATPTQSICPSGYTFIDGKCKIAASAQNVAAPSVSISLSPATFIAGQTVALNWSSQNATTCTLNNQIVQTSGSQNITIGTVGTSYTISCTGQGGTSLQTLTTNYSGGATANQNPTLTAYTTTPNITAGQSAIINLVSTNLQSCVVNGGVYNNNSVTVNGNITVNPTTTTTYIFNCIGLNGQNVSAQVLVNVNNLTSSVITLNSNINNTTSGQPVVLTWNGPAGSYSCILSNLTNNVNVSNNLPASGSYTVNPTSTTTYEIECKNNLAQSLGKGNITINVVNGTSLNQLTVQSTLNKTSFVPGETITITSVVKNNGTTTISFPSGSSSCPSDVKVMIGGIDFYTFTNQQNRICTTDYRIETLQPGQTLTRTFTGIIPSNSFTQNYNVVTNLYGNNNQILATDNDSISVSSNNSNSQINISPLNQTIQAGQTLNMNISSVGLNSCMIFPSNGTYNFSVQAINGNGQFSVTPIANAIYTVTCKKANGQNVSASFNVMVSNASANIPIINSFTSNPATISTGQSTTLSWNSTNATSCSLNAILNGVSTNIFTNLLLITSGSITVNPTQSTQYSLSCSNSSGNIVWAYTSVGVNTQITNNYYDSNLQANVSISGKSVILDFTNNSNSCNNFTLNFGDNTSSSYSTMDSTCKTIVNKTYTNAGQYQIIKTVNGQIIATSYITVQ